MPVILKPLLAKPGLRRAPGAAGHIDGGGTPFPQHFKWSGTEGRYQALTRPSRAHVAARLPISKQQPSTPANIGSTPMPRTTLASRNLHPEPVVALVGVARAHREDARHVERARGVGDAARVAAAGVGDGAEHVGRRRHLGELTRMAGPT